MFVLDFLKTAVGFLLGSQAGTANKVAGVVNYAWALPALAWIWYHRAETIIIQIVLDHGGKPDTIQLLTTTYLGGSLIIGAIFAYIEFGRRAP